jgi:nucleoside-diphosphate-sugar epimerase
MINNIIITGATGFVGNNLIPYLKKNNFIVNPLKVMTGHELSSCTSDAVIHLAGIAHELNQISHSSEYYKVNTELTIKLFDSFLLSEIRTFIFFSSVKAVTDSPEDILTEDYVPNPQTHYGKSKLLAENYILSKRIPSYKRVYILRPCMIHGPNSKGNLNLLYKTLSQKKVWPLASYKNERSFLTIENLCFIIKELLESKNIDSGVYNLADDGAISTNELIKIIGDVIHKKIILLTLPKLLIRYIARIGDYFVLTFNTHRLNKLTENYVVSNRKILSLLKKDLPINIKEGLINTIKSFQENKK